jgi:hypothetical protein
MRRYSRSQLKEACVKSYIAIGMALLSSSVFAAADNWSSAERDSFIRGCSLGAAEPAYSDYLKRHNLPEPEPSRREEVIQQAISKGGPFWAMCSCVTDEISKRWDQRYIAAHRAEVEALLYELIGGKCKMGS